MTHTAAPRNCRSFRLAFSLFGAFALGALCTASAGCSADGGSGDANSPGNAGAGGHDNGSSGSASSAGSANPGTGGTAQTNGGSGSSQAGSASGGSGGMGSAGSSQGGNPSGGSSAGGAANGGAGTAGMSAGGSNAGAGAGGGSSGTLPAKIVAGYYPNWTPAPPRIKDVESHYNLIYLFAAKPVGGTPGTTGAVFFDLPGDGNGAKTNFNADIAYARSTQKRKIILSVGGAGAGMSFPNRQKSQTFVDSVSGLYKQFGGFDGLDWNTFEADQNPDTDEMIWISLELKRKYPGFIISAPPAPWNQRDKTFCSTMVKAGAMDYAAPQYYDGPNLATESYITGSVAEWAKLVGASKLVVGFGVWDQPNYMNIADAVSTWKAVAKANPGLRGAFDWQIFTDQAQGWPFATQVGPLVAP